MATWRKAKPKDLKLISKEDFILKLNNHRKFVLTKGSSGQFEDFSGYDFSDRSFNSAILQGADFRGSWLRNTDFSLANLKNCNFEDCWVYLSKTNRTKWINANIKGTLWEVP
jgi:uncharacterized protein YjbI with pentapeptide repeats